MKFKILIFSLLCLLLLNNCSSFSEAGKVLRNEKVRTTDEFLIKKKEPLTQPPDFDTIPEPGSTENKAEKEENSIESILSSNTSKSDNTNSSSSSTEESILNQIKK
ncbi:MAG: DUF3035 domain-containing protein [Pelagibacteraceae bacterium]|jgi:hypothetical protein